jgi:hypothetical protein
VGGVAAGLAVAAVIQHQHALVVGRGGRVGHQQLDPALVDPLMIPAGLAEEPLQALHGRVLGANDRLGAGQRGHGLVTVAGQQQPLQVGAQAAALRQPGEQGVELDGVVLQRAGGSWAGKALGHCAHLRAQAAELLLYTQPSLKSTNYRWCYVR